MCAALDLCELQDGSTSASTIYFYKLSTGERVRSIDHKRRLPWDFSLCLTDFWGTATSMSSESATPARDVERDEDVVAGPSSAALPGLSDGDHHPPVEQKKKKHKRYIFHKKPLIFCNDGQQVSKSHWSSHFKITNLIFLNLYLIDYMTFPVTC